MEPHVSDALRQRLLALREKVMGEMANLEHGALNQSPKDQSGDLSGYSIHIADTASDSYDREFNLGLASHEQQMLNDIDAALSKIESGEYGICEQCEEPIDVARLSAVPYAKLCLRCKAHQEKTPTST